MEVFHSTTGRTATNAKSLHTGQGIALLRRGIGVLLLVLTACAWWKEHAFLTRAEHANGVMVSIDPRQAGGGHEYYLPTFTFLDQAGQPHRVTSRLSISSTSYHVGESVDVFYEPGKPEEAQVHGFFERWGVAVIGGAFGAVFLLPSAGFSVLLGRWPRQAATTRGGV